MDGTKNECGFFVSVQIMRLLINNFAIIILTGVAMGKCVLTFFILLVLCNRCVTSGACELPMNRNQRQ